MPEPAGEHPTPVHAVGATAPAGQKPPAPHTVSICAPEAFGALHAMPAVHAPSSQLELPGPGGALVLWANEPEAKPGGTVVTGQGQDLRTLQS